MVVIMNMFKKISLVLIASFTIGNTTLYAECPDSKAKCTFENNNGKKSTSDMTVTINSKTRGFSGCQPCRSKCGKTVDSASEQCDADSIASFYQKGYVEMKNISYKYNNYLRINNN